MKSFNQNVRVKILYRELIYERVGSSRVIEGNWGSEGREKAWGFGPKGRGWRMKEKEEGGEGKMFPEEVWLCLIKI